MFGLLPEQTLHALNLVVLGSSPKAGNFFGVYTYFLYFLDLYRFRPINLGGCENIELCIFRNNMNPIWKLA